MQPSQNERFLPLDGLRGLAVISVLAYHTANVPVAGRVGVDLFFVLSGFLITKILISEARRTGSVDLVNFYWRRIVRLYPALLLACAFFLCLMWAVPGVDSRPIASVAASLLMIANYTRAVEWDFPTAMGHTWSLAVEWQFYMLWPPIFLFIRAYSSRRRYLVGFLGLGVAGVWLSRYHHPDTVWLWSALDTRADGLLYGAMIAVLLDYRRSFRVPAVILVAAITALIFVALRTTASELYISNAASAVVVLGIVQVTLPSLNKLLSIRPLVYVGQISYGLYLYHFPIAALLYVEGYTPFANLIVTAVSAFILADFSWRFVERPALRESRRVHAEATA